MKFTLEINSRFGKIMLVITAVLLALNLAKSMFTVNKAEANGYYEEDYGKYVVQHMGQYPDVHLFKRTGKKIVCIGKCTVNEKDRTYAWVPFNKGY